MKTIFRQRFLYRNQINCFSAVACLLHFKLINQKNMDVKQFKLTVSGNNSGIFYLNKNTDQIHANGKCKFRRKESIKISTNFIGLNLVEEYIIIE